MILFLDIDGVLHPKPLGEAEVFCRVEMLWRILRSCPGLEVVFSTSWTEAYAFDYLVEFVTHGGGEDLTHRFIGATPSIVRGEGASILKYCREEECRQWMSNAGKQDVDWIAVDDDEQEFSPKCRQVYLVDRAMGLTGEDADRVIQKILGLHPDSSDRAPI